MVATLQRLPRLLRGPALATAVRIEGTRTVVSLEGEADFSVTATLAGTLAQVVADRAADVVVDLSATAVIDSAAVRTLAIFRELLDTQSRRLTFRSPSKTAALVLDMFGLSELIDASNGVSWPGPMQPVGHRNPQPKKGGPPCTSE